MTNNAAPVFSNQYGHIYRVLAPCLNARWSHNAQEQKHKMFIGRRCKHLYICAPDLLGHMQLSCFYFLDLDNQGTNGKHAPINRCRTFDWHTNCKFSKEWFSLSTAVSSARDFWVFVKLQLEEFKDVFVAHTSLEWQSLICRKNFCKNRLSLTIFPRRLFQCLEES